MATDGSESQSTQLQELCDSILSRRPLILASNRGPVEYRIAADRPEARRSSGGVVTALNSLSQSHEFTWISSSLGQGDRKVAETSVGHRVKSPIVGHRIFTRFVLTPRRVYHKFYSVFCNPLLWFLQHYMWNGPYSPNVDQTVYDAWHTGYVPVNQAFAQVVLQEAERSPIQPIIMIHDYHLYLTAGYVRKSLPDAVIQHFNHIPWPASRYWQLLPYYMRKDICSSLCSADVVAFQTPNDVHNFLNTCEEVLPDSKVDYVANVVNWNGRVTKVRAYPVSINVSEIRRMARSARSLEYYDTLKPLCNDKTIVRIDRAEPSKNIIRGFRAYKALLSRHPELRGRVTFLAFLVPSRTHIRQYQRYMAELQQEVNDINSVFGDDQWQPIVPFYENNYIQAISAMKLYDVLLANSVIDGMNLVAKEGAVVNTKGGVVILSESSGSYPQLREGVLSVSPSDIEGTQDAIYRALTMGMEERRSLANILCQAVEKQDINHWLYQQFDGLTDLSL